MARIRFDNPNERELFHARESWIPVILGGLPVLALGALACVALCGPVDRPDLLPWGVAITIGVTLLSRVPHVLDNWRTDVVVSDRRLYYRRGIVDVKDHVCDLSSITDVTVDPSILGRVFRYADITVQTQAGDDDFVLKQIHDAYQMRRVINQGRDAAEDAGQLPPRRPPRAH